MDEYMKHCIQIFYDVCMNICSVSSCENKTLNHIFQTYFMLEMQNCRAGVFLNCWD